MNDPFLVEEAGHLARRVRDLAGESPEERVRMAYLLTLSRQPKPEEIQIGRDHLRKQERNYVLANASPQKASRRRCPTSVRPFLPPTSFSIWNNG